MPDGMPTELQRLAVLRDYAILDTPPEPSFDGIARVAAHLCNTPIALVSFLDEDRQWFKARVGMSVCQTRRADAFCAYTILTEHGLIVPDTHEDERFRENPLVVSPPHLRFYAGVPLLAPGGVAIGSLCVLDREPREIADQQMDDLRDLAAHVVGELELRRSRAEACAANRAKSQFVANVSHEIRTPLTAIVGFTQLLRQSDQIEEVERLQWINLIHQNARQLLGMVNDLLDVPRVEAGDLGLQARNVYIRRLIGEAYAGIRAAAMEKRLDIEVEVDPAVPELLVTDGARLRQVVASVLDNAVKFTDAGRIVMRVLVESAEQGSLLRIDIADTGRGITDRDVDRVMGCFEQSDASTTRGHAGMGLGLYISRGICERLGGSLRIASSDGVGTTVTIRVPAICPAPTVTPCSCEPSPQAAPLPAAPAPVPTSRRVLVVDDVPANRRLMEVMLRRSGVAVEVASNGQEAVDLLARQRFDAVLMDMQMPVMDGYTATRTLRQREDQTPVIAITAHAMVEDEAKCLAAGCDGYLAKPIRIEDVIDVLTRVLDHRRAA